MAATNQFFCPASHSVAGLFLLSKTPPPPVGASLLAMIVNEDACKLGNRGALESIAGKPAPTGVSGFPGRSRWPWFPPSTCPCRHSRHRSRSAPAPAAPV
ncbi:hypothetical protein EI969_00990 [Pseudomonas sp. PB101]|nr:hypothetical protein [Pseudomonas sp. PB101]